MDDRDLRLVHALLADPLASAAEMARIVGITAPTVRNRLQRLEQVGLIGGFFALPAAPILGRQAHIWPIGAHARGGASPARLLDHDDVVWVAAKDHGGVSVLTYDRPDATPGHALAPYGVVPSDGRLQSAAPSLDGVVPSPLDWRILRAMVERPRGTVTDLAAATGLTRRTVTARRAALMATNAVSVNVAFLAPRDPGTLIFTLFMHGSDELHVRNAVAAEPHVYELNSIADPPGAYCLAQAATYAEARALEARLQEADGIHEVVVTLNSSFHVATARLAAWCHEREQDWARARRRRPGAK